MLSVSEIVVNRFSSSDSTAGRFDRGDAAATVDEQDDAVIAGAPVVIDHRSRPRLDSRR